jgi:type IV secretion system protein VirD4
MTWGGIALAALVLDCVVLPWSLWRSTPGATAEDVLGQWFLLNLVAGSAALWYVFGRKTKPTKPEDASGYGSHGTARFAKRQELREYLKSDGPGLVLGKESGKYLILPPDPRQVHNQNVTVIGGSGARKTRSFVQPNVLQAARYGGESLIVVDPKAEIYANSAQLLRGANFQVHILNLLQMDHSDRWNPLDAVRTVEEASSLAVNLVANTVNPNRPRTSDPFWDNAEQAFITALVLYVKRHRPRDEQHLASVLELGTELAPEALDDIFKKLDPTDAAYRFYRSFLRAEDKIRAGVVAGLGSRLQLWNDPAVVSLTSTSDFEIADFGYEPSALFLVIPDSKDTFAPLLALFWQQAFEILYRVADEHGGRLMVPVRCRMDEIANCGFIPGYEKKKSTMRSRGISTEEIWQSLGQIKARYPNVWTELLANADHMLFLGTNDLETAQYISQKMGQTTIRLQTQGSSQSERDVTASQSETYGQRPLLTPDEILRLPPSEALLMARGIYPARVKKADFTEHPLAGQIRLADHKEYKPPARSPVSITDVKALWKAALKRDTPQADQGRAPVQEKEQKQDDPTVFLDGDKTKGGKR